MRVLDYSGLARLTANIKSYIASLMKPLNDNAPLVMEGFCYVLGKAFLKGTSGPTTAEFTPTPGTPVTLTPSSSGTAAKLYNRLAKGLPSALYVPVTSTPVSPYGTLGNWPFFPSSETGSSSQSATITAVTYSCPAGRIYSANSSTSFLLAHDLKIVFTRQASLPARPTKIEIYAPQVVQPLALLPADSQLLPFFSALFSVSASGTVSPAGNQTISDASSGEALKFYQRLKKGFPPAVGVNITAADGTTKRTIWLFQDTASGTSANSVMYKSGTLANGQYSNKYLRLAVAVYDADANARLNLGMFTVA